MGHIKTLQQQVFQNKVAHDFNTTDVAMEFLLTYGELAEAYDAWRKKKDDLGEEIADVMIYLMGLAELLGLDLDAEIKAKMLKNSARRYIKKEGVLLKEEDNE